MASGRTVSTRTRMALMAAFCSIILVGGVAVAGTVQPVRDRPGVVERDPAASQGYLAWAQVDGRRFNSFVKPDGAPRIRMNRRGIRGFSVGIDGTTAVFEMARRQSDNTDLKMFDVIAQTRSDPVAGVNTNNSEFQPALSGDWLFFTRDTSPTAGRHARLRAVLFNTSTSEKRVLTDLRAGNHYLVTNQVNGDWATFETCDVRGGFSNCQVWLYRISTDTLTQVPNPDRQQYSSAVAGDGTLYFVRSGNADHWLCGKNVRIVRLPEGGSEQVIGTIPDGKDVFASFALEEADTSTTLLFDRLTCSGDGGIYEIANADTAT